MFGCNTFWLVLLCSSVRIVTRTRRWIPSTRTPDSRQEPTAWYLPPSDKTTWGIRPSSHPMGSGTKRPGRRTARSLPFIAEVEDVWRCTLISPWTVMVAGCLLLFYIRNKICRVTRLATSEIRRCGYLVCPPCFHSSPCRMCPWQIEQLVQIREPWKHVVVWMCGFLRKYHVSVSLDIELSLLFLCM
jgi:hypothetical protein